MSDLKRVSDLLIAHCRSGTTRAGLDELYAEDAVSVEAVCMPGKDSRETLGKQAIHGKHEWWERAMEVHSQSSDGPYLHGEDRFAVIFEVDATDRDSGNRMKMKEVGVYTVADGKIVREEFFYTM